MMNISVMTVSFPLDGETLKEVKLLCEEATVQDYRVYETIMNVPMASSFENKGFMVLAYEDDKDLLVGAASAIDLMGLHTYEWSLVVTPAYRQKGIGTALVEGIQVGLKERGAEGQLAVVIDGSPYGHTFIENKGFTYSFSETTLETKAEPVTLRSDINIQAYNGEQAELITIYCEAFGDLPEESEELIAFNTSTNGRELWVAYRDGAVVGTVTTAKENEIQWVTALAVHPNCEGQGIGTALLSFSKDYASKVGAAFVMLDVEVDNKKALSVYEKAGFMKAQQIDYYVKQ
ncbi:GNAT family N-acetyltransferase [Lysinibacillus capsici]|jgi:mycothiol synthase|nr:MULTISPECIES: GNAT family N-acetyltransferase [Lysinibacillus]MCT1539503.1 GNAT family N-acetyltransferase [Lysinibacillus capsici]MCT1570430.1 GNAT family N-acetyltransferase [Lysinibacillus capsici]MCT1647662.1 GNAT family N-acetyltransferase [Lysinibacillus capsici]MCT1726059.1 GNAT family N-acetyltransferase [Lysinibacillus capsici]MCT1783164.1 GNAT family N-acetyltransferase [Lysinibacillus capsici]